jgi:hypothetical protein
MNKNHAKILNLFLDDMVKLSFDNGFPGFFYKSRAHVMVVLLIIKSSINKEDISFEEICHIIPKVLASRTTIKTILDQGSKQKFFTKIIPETDKRKKIYEPTHSTKTFIIDWIRRNNEIFKLIST